MHINSCAETSRTSWSLTFLVLLPYCSSALPIVLEMYLIFYGESSVVWSDEIELGQYTRVWSTIFSLNFVRGRCVEGEVRRFNLNVLNPNT